MKNGMSNFEIKVVADTPQHFKLAMEAAFFDHQEQFVAKKHYDKAKSWAVKDGWLILSKLGADNDYAKEGLTLLPMAMNHEQATDFAFGWFMSDEAKTHRGEAPQIDGSASVGAFIVEATHLGIDRWHEIVRVKPTWALHHK
jgi:hypothetical protein